MCMQDVAPLKKECKLRRFADLNTPFPNNCPLQETIYHIHQQFWSTETLVSFNLFLEMRRKQFRTPRKALKLLLYTNKFSFLFFLKFHRLQGGRQDASPDGDLDQGKSQNFLLLNPSIGGRDKVCS